jgi:hypothetical protein
MTIQEANKMYQVAVGEINNNYQLIFYTVLLVVLFAAIVIIFIKNKKIENWFMLIAFIVLISNVIFFGYNVKKIEKNIVEWEKRVIKETINTLPVEKIELLDYLITNDKEIEDGRAYILSENKNSKVIEIIYSENGIKTRDTIEANIKKVKGLETPYIKTQSLENNIPTDPNNTVYKKGFYNTTIYVPE